MKVIRFADRDFAQRCGELLAPSSLFDPEIEQRTREIIEAVRARGDAALIELAQRFDGVTLAPDQLAVTRAELVTAAVQVSPELRAAIAAAAANIRRFSRRSLRRNWATHNAQGGWVGEKFDPFQRVGIYIPGGAAPLISTALMTVVLAQVAGCPEIVVCTPCGHGGAIHPGLLYAARMAGATEIYKAGGAQAIAALALGTRSIPRVDKIFGPGNAYVVAAKRVLFGRVAVDLLPGPSELLALADDRARPKWIAADLLAQAEHGSGYERIWLVTPSKRVLEAVARELDKQRRRLVRREAVDCVLDRHTWLVQVESIDQGIALTNRIAPEHCEVHCRRAAKIADRLTTAGAIFLGPFSPTVLGDYLAGPSHVLPTGGAGASFAGLTVDQFQRRTSLVRYDRAALRKSIEPVRALAEAEGLGAHARSAAIRTGK